MAGRAKGPGIRSAGGMADLGQPPTAAGARLNHLRAAQLRTRMIRGGIVKLVFGSIFLVGALAHALSPQRHEQSSLFWITLLVLMSTINVATGLRALGRARRLRGRLWLPVTASWGLLAIVLLGLLLRR